MDHSGARRHMAPYCYRRAQSIGPWWLEYSLPFGESEGTKSPEHLSQVKSSIKSFQNVKQNYIKSSYRRFYRSNNVLVSSMCNYDIMLNSKLMRHWYKSFNSCRIWIAVIWYKYMDPFMDDSKDLNKLMVGKSMTTASASSLFIVCCSWNNFQPGM